MRSLRTCGVPHVAHLSDVSQNVCTFRIVGTLNIPKSHQRIISERHSQNTGSADLFGVWWKDISPSLSNCIVKRISYKIAEPIILEHEWIGTMPLPKSCRYMFGIYFNGHLGGAVVYVEPSTRQFNDEYPRQALQLNRGACVFWTPKNSASKLIAESLKMLKQENIKIVLAYCTPEAGEAGTIYQSLGFWYVGRTQPSYSYYLDEHWISERTLADKKKWARTKDKRWAECFNNLPRRQLVGKFKYVKLIGTHRQNKDIAKRFGYTSLPYPKRAEKVSRAIRPASGGEGVVQSHGSAIQCAEEKGKCKHIG